MRFDQFSDYYGNIINLTVSINWTTETINVEIIIDFEITELNSGLPLRMK